MKMIFFGVFHIYLFNFVCYTDSSNNGGIAFVTLFLHGNPE